MTPDLLVVATSFNIGLVIGAGIAWGLVMYRWEPVVGVENEENCCPSESGGGPGSDVGTP